MRRYIDMRHRFIDGITKLSLFTPVQCYGISPNSDYEFFRIITIEPRNVTYQDIRFALPIEDLVESGLSQAAYTQFDKLPLLTQPIRDAIEAWQDVGGYSDMTIEEFIDKTVGL